MLERTFIHAQGIGPTTERRLWQEGAATWRDFLAAPERFRLPRGRRALLADVVAQSPAALEAGDYRFFRDRLPQREHWRALHAFHGRVGYLDIETDGGADFDNVTVIGLADGRTFRRFVRGENLLDFEEAVDEFALLVTYFGGGFDLPVLRNAFPRARLDQLHLDLCPTLRRLGFTGGLKAVERQVGIARSPETAGLNGWDAVRLWRQAQWGSREALDLLLAYNREDVVNLIPLARLAFRGLEAECLKDLV
jgi:uncharacterized protein YprB with RNaseH-like and TPR domain